MHLTPPGPVSVVENNDILRTPKLVENHTYKISHEFNFSAPHKQDKCVRTRTHAHTYIFFFSFLLTPTKESQTLTKGFEIDSDVISALFQASLEAISLATSNRLIFITSLYYWECGATLLLPGVEGITQDELEQDPSSPCHLLHMSLNYLSSHKAGSQKPITL